MKKEKIFSKPLIIFALLSMIVCLASCRETDTPAAEYDDHTEYAGIWQSEPGDDRAFVFNEDGTYQLYSVKPGASPKLEEQGTFKVRGSRLNLAKDSDGEGFAITDQLSISSSGKLVTNYADFERISDDTDPAFLETLTTIIVPLEEYIGEWENDTVYAQLTISETGYKLNEVESISSALILLAGIAL